MRRLAVVLCCLGITLVSGCRRAPFPRANVLVIGIDTLRADRLGCYGYLRPTSPRIDAFATEAAVFANAIAQSPWTLPSFASMFTGRLPSAHRAGEGRLMKRTRLDPGIPTLATALRGAGWRTGSFVSNGFAGGNVGLTTGFERTWQWLDSGSAVAQAEKFIREVAAERFYVFLHMVDPHQPYAPPPEDAAAFIDPTYTGQVGMAFKGWARPGLTAADRRRINDLYDAEVRVSDRRVGAAIDLLRELDLLDRTIVVIVSDHGEELFDHAMLGHGHTLYDELLHVPLLIRFPSGRWKGRLDTQVRAMDLFPTLLDALGLPIPGGIDGVSLMPLVRGDTSPSGADTAVAEYLFRTPERKAVRRAGLKLVYTPVSNLTQAFDLANDPRERTNVARDRRADVAALMTVLERDVLRGLEGLQLLARGGRLAHRLQLRLVSPRPLADVALVGTDADDALRVSDDGRIVEVMFDLPAAPEKDPEAGDIDGLRFRAPEDAAFTVGAELDGAPFPFQHFYLGNLSGQASGSPPWQFAPADRRLLVSYPPALAPSPEGGVRVALFNVHRPPPPIAALDEQTRESLRQLGYIE